MDNGEYLHLVDDWITRRLSAMDVPGLTVAIYRSDNVVFNKAYGRGGDGGGLTKQHLFPIGSQSKMITATAIMQLVQAGRLRLEDRAVAHIPWLANHDDPNARHITIHQLLWHGAGLVRDGNNADYWQLVRPFPTERQLRNIVLASCLTCRPGQKVKYSNIGYGLLGQIIKSVSGQSYVAFCQSQVLQPLGLQMHIQPPNNLPQAIGLSAPIAGKRLAVPASIATNALTPATGWWATAADVCRFLAVHFCSDQRLLSDSTKRAMHSGGRDHWRPRAQRSIAYGLGFQTYDFDGRQWIGHGGATAGHRSLAAFDPRRHIAISVMANTKDVPVHSIFRGIVSILDYFERHGGQPTKPSLLPFAARLAGPGGVLQTVPIGNRLTIACIDDWLPLLGAERLRQTGPTTFVIESAHDLAACGEEVHFALGPKGVRSARYAGNTFLPEAAYLRWLKANFKRHQA